MKRVIAFEYNKAVTSGRTKPSVLTCLGSDGPVEVVAKFSAGCDLGCAGLVCEAISAALARALGLPVADSFLVEVPDELIELVPDSDRRAQMKASCRIAFGCELKTGFSPYVKSGRGSDDAELALASGIWLFDAISQNADRRVSNPNLLISGTHWLMIDHELAWPTVPLIGAKRQWEVGGLQHLASKDDGRHALTDFLLGNTLDLSAHENGWTAMAEARIQAWAACLPPEWGAQNVARVIWDQMKNAQRNLSGIMTEVKRVLNA